MVRIFFLALIMVFGSSVFALAEPPVAPPNPLPIGEEPPELNCTEVVAELRKHNTMARSHDMAVADFTAQVSIIMTDWHTELKPLEGETITLPTGKFDPIIQGSGQVDEVTSMVYENSGFLEGRLNEIIDKVESCINKK